VDEPRRWAVYHVYHGMFQIRATLGDSGSTSCSVWSNSSAIQTGGALGANINGLSTAFTSIASAFIFVKALSLSLSPRHGFWVRRERFLQVPQTCQIVNAIILIPQLFVLFNSALLSIVP
jgi:hypothetical protein